MSSQPWHKYDIAVVGAGPAGSACAARLAAAGATVALIDPSHPREKPCGGGVTRRALALLDDGTPWTPPEGCAVSHAAFRHAGRAATVAMDADGDRLRVFSRREFDRALVDRAVARGASLLPLRVSDVTQDGSAWRIATSGGPLVATWLIGADGANSLVRKRVSVPFARADLSIACGYFIAGAASSRIDIGFEARPAGYFWSFPRRDHLAVGVCAQADESSVAQLMPVVDRWLADFRLPSTSLGRYSWPIPSLRAATFEREQPAGRHWMLIGDAAGLVDPITREGIFFALQSGEFAASSLLEERDSSAAYVTRLRDAIYPELMLASRIRARFYRPAFTSLLISALHRSARIRGVMADLVAGEQPYGSLRTRLLKTFEWRLMLELAYRT